VWGFNNGIIRQLNTFFGGLARETLPELVVLFIPTLPVNHRRCFFMTYSDYLKTDHWKLTRSNALLRNPECVFCDSATHLQVHHKTYSHNDVSILFGEEPKNLYVVCASCHRLLHYYFGTNVHKLNKIKLRIRRLIELGVVKKKAFWIVSTPQMYEGFMDWKQRIGFSGSVTFSA
jgi:hypothetical protein